jgi:hypothetical protein
VWGRIQQGSRRPLLKESCVTITRRPLGKSIGTPKFRQGLTAIKTRAPLDGIKSHSVKRVKVAGKTPECSNGSASLSADTATTWICDPMSIPNGPAGPKAPHHSRANPVLSPAE